MFSLTDGEPVARIRQGESNGKLLRIKTMNFDVPLIEQQEPESEPNSEDDEPFDDYDELINKVRGSKKLGKSEEALLTKAILDRKKGKPINRSYSLDGREFKLYDGMMSLVPAGKVPHRLWIVAPSNSGKSVFTAQYAADFKKRHPQSMLYVFSDVESDPVIDKLDPIRIKLDHNIWEKPIQVSELKSKVDSPNLVIFDDIDACTDRKVSKAILELRNSVMTRGRHEGLSVICTNHLTNNGSETKKVINEATHIVLFPKASKISNYFTKNYISDDAEMINRALRQPSRWVCFSRTAPTFVLYSCGAYLI